MKPRKAIRRSVKPIKRRVRPRVRRGDPTKRRWASHRDPVYKKWIKGLACLICRRQPVDPAHVRPQSLGGDDQGNLVPLCRLHHDQQEGRTAAFELQYGVDLAEVAHLLTVAYKTEAA